MPDPVNVFEYWKNSQLPNVFTLLIYMAFAIAIGIIRPLNRDGHSPGIVSSPDEQSVSGNFMRIPYIAISLSVFLPTLGMMLNRGISASSLSAISNNILILVTTIYVIVVGCLLFTEFLMSRESRDNVPSYFPPLCLVFGLPISYFHLIAYYNPPVSGG